MIEPTWIVMPVLAGPEVTEAAISDCLAQSVPTRLLVVNQGVDDAFRERLERIAEVEAGRVFVWSHVPPLPSLSATWNRALKFVWGTCSGTREVEWTALVVNNDVRLHSETIQRLQRILARERALFVSCVGVTAEQFDPSITYSDYDFWDAHSDEPSRAGQLLRKGGPDFSCFLISYECHDRFQFDEGFIPAFCEDLDYHRRLMLAGEGGRIFSVNLPYLHLASQTLKALEGKEAERIRREIETVSRTYYAEKWGGAVNEEIYLKPFWKFSARGDVTTPEMQANQTRAGGLLSAEEKRYLGGQGNWRPSRQEELKAEAAPLPDQPIRNAAGQVIDWTRRNDAGQRYAFPPPPPLPPPSGPGPFTDAFDEQQYKLHAEAAGATTFEREDPDSPSSSRRRGSAGNWEELNAETLGGATDGEAPGGSQPQRPADRLDDPDLV